MTGLFFIFSNSVLVKINQISYNDNYVKWRNFMILDVLEII